MLGPRIAVLRREAGWSQGELARLLQVSPSAVGMYEQGRREPSAQILVDLSRLFGVTVDYLLTGKPAPGEENRIHSAVDSALGKAENQLSGRRERPFSRQELAVLFAAMLME